MTYLCYYLAIGAGNVAFLAIDRIRCGQWADKSNLGLSLAEVAFWLLAWPVQLLWALVFRVIGPTIDYLGNKIAG